MTPFSLQSLRIRARHAAPLLAALLVLALVVVAQDLHVPAQHGHEEVAAMAVEEPHSGPDAAHSAEEDCSGGICSLCLALHFESGDALPAVVPSRQPMRHQQPVPAPVERLFRPPIPFA